MARRLQAAWVMGRRGTLVHEFKTEVPRGLEEGCFETAVYRFLELSRGRPRDEAVTMRSEPRGPVVAKSVTLWSDEAVNEFRRFWLAFRREQSGRAPFPPRWRSWGPDAL